jgi:hypothetical protein
MGSAGPSERQKRALVDLSIQGKILGKITAIESEYPGMSTASLMFRPGRRQRAR